MRLEPSSAAVAVVKVPLPGDHKELCSLVLRSRGANDTGSFRIEHRLDTLLFYSILSLEETWELHFRLATVREESSSNET